MKSLEKRKKFIDVVKSLYGPTRNYVTRQEILEIVKKDKTVKFPFWLRDPEYKLSRGKFKLPRFDNAGDITEPDLDVEFNVPQEKPKKVFIDVNFLPQDGLIPNGDPTFVPFGSYSVVKEIIKSGVFLPTYISGPTRSGKTLIPLQICSELRKNLYRANITAETDESDLLGGYKLINGNTVWEDGPAVKAAEDPSGAILLLDEIDLGSTKLLCLQPLLEGNGIYIKKINRWVRPTVKFNIIATANTKGRGSDDGRYIGTNIMNEALLERFPIMVEQGYAPKKIERTILKKNLVLFGIVSPDFIENLCQWAENIRKTYEQGGVDETISTGRLVYIVKSYVVFGRNRLKAIKNNIARFDVNTQTSFLDMYMKIDDKAYDGSDEIEPPNNTVIQDPKTTW